MNYYIMCDYKLIVVNISFGYNEKMRISNSALCH